MRDATHPALPVVQSPVLSSSSAKISNLPTVRALERLWQKAQNRSFLAPRGFFKLIALRRRMRLTEAAASRQALCLPEGKVNDCSACTDICCVGPRAQVLLRLRDMAMLHDIKKTDLMTHEKTAYSAQELSERPALKRQVRARDWSIFPKLKQNSFGACVALSPDGLCSLYPYWPMTCARFPYSLHVTDEEIFFSSRCQSYFIHPSRQPMVEQGRIDAVATYNERIRDAILLTLFRSEIEDLGLLAYLRL